MNAMRITAVFLCTALPWIAQARDLDGSLGLIRSPNDGRPALLLPGESFTAEVAAKAGLFLRAGEAEFPVDSEWTEWPGDRFTATCSVPPHLAPGQYSLVARTGNTEDVNLRSVYIYESFPDTYTVAHITDTRIGSKRHPRSSKAIFASIVDALNEADPDLVLVTGNLTEDGSLEQFESFISTLNDLEAPTFICAGSRDRQGPYYKAFFDKVRYAFRFGHDGYLAFDSTDYVVADGLGTEVAELQRLRRSIKSSRWSIGFTHRYEPRMGILAQLILFVDAPLDFLVFGHWHREAPLDEIAVPWGSRHGRTRMMLTPAAIDGQLRYVEVGPHEPKHADVLQAASTTD